MLFLVFFFLHQVVQKEASFHFIYWLFQDQRECLFLSQSKNIKEDINLIA